MFKIDRQYKNQPTSMFSLLRKNVPNQKINLSEGIFAQQFNDQYGIQLQKEVSGLIQQIDQNGKRFSESPSFENLALYKKDIQTFFRFVVKHAYNIKDIYGRRLDYKLLNTINKKLDDLSEVVTAQETERLSLLAKLDEIKGLIIDLIY